MECVCPILGEKTQVEETPFSRDHWTIVRCLKTGFVFLANPPDYSQLESDYDYWETFPAETKRRQRAEPVLAKISSLSKALRFFLFPKRNIICKLTQSVVQKTEKDRLIHCLDVGCGWGNLLQEIHRRFARIGRTIVPNGIEISRECADHSKKIIGPLGGKLIRASGMEGMAHFHEGSIDVVILSSFLEHERQPLEFLKRIHPILGPDGVIVLKVPNFASWNRILRGPKWCGFRYPDHVNYFTPRTLQLLANTAGFTIARQGLLEKFPFNDNMYAVLRKS